MKPLLRVFAIAAAALVLPLSACGDDESGSSSGDGGGGSAEATGGVPGEELCDILAEQEIGSEGTASLTNTVVLSETAAQRKCDYTVGDTGGMSMSLALSDSSGNRSVMEQSVSEGSGVEVAGYGDYAVFIENGGLQVIVDEGATLTVNVFVAEGDAGGAVSDQEASEAAAEIALPEVEDQYR